MNIVRSIYDREQGRGLSNSYSIALRRLKCYDFNEFRGISPSTVGPDFNPEPPTFACRFCTTSGNEHLLALANEDGKIAIQDTNVRSDHSPFEGHQAHNNAIFDIAWAPGEMRLVSASGDHTAVLWDVANSTQLEEVARFHGHTRTVKTVAFPQEDKNIFATGARDGVIMIWDTRIQNNTLQVRPDNLIRNSHSAPGTPSNVRNKKQLKQDAMSRASSITGLVFQDNHHLISCAAGDGKVKVWDLRKSYSTYRREPQPRYSLTTPRHSSRNGFTCLALDPSKLRLYASCVDNTIYCFNAGTYEEQPVGKFTGHINSTVYVKACLSPDGRYLLSGSSDEHAYIWDTHIGTEKLGNPLVKLVGHGAEVTSVAWCPVGGIRIVTCSDDARHCLWRVGLEHEGDNDQIELHGWAEEFNMSKKENKEPTLDNRDTPSTPSFQTLQRWAPCVQRTPDGATGTPPVPCASCYRMATPCLRCAATRASIPSSVPATSKKRLEVLWEQEETGVGTSTCPECEREARRAASFAVPTNADVPARRLFSPCKKRHAESSSPEEPPPKLRSERSGGSPNKAIICPSTPYKRLAEGSSADSPRKRLRLNVSAQEKCEGGMKSPKKRMREDGIACTLGEEHRSPKKKFLSDRSSNTPKTLEPIPGPSGSPLKQLNQDRKTTGDHDASPVKRFHDTPSKRRFSERRTDSPHKRYPSLDDLQGIAKIDDAVPSTSSGITAMNRTRLCARHMLAGCHSPTLNLPNYVVDGTSPHHSCSPARRLKENVNWLTRLSRRKSADKRTDCSSTQPQVTPVRATSGRTAHGCTTPGRTTPGRTTPGRITPGKSEKKPPKRRPSNAETSTSCPSESARASSENLLKFFRVTGKTCEQQCVPETSNTTNPAHTPVNTPIV